MVAFAKVGQEDAVLAAINHMGRSERDIVRDRSRYPADILRLSGISPGMRVLDLFSGGGYYSELFSRVVGADGGVIAHNNAAYETLLRREILGRYGDNRLPNVERLLVEADDLRVAEASQHLIFLNLTYHDFFYSSPSWPGVDEQALLAKLRMALRPGGRVVLIDHAAAAGRGVRDTDTLHRIDEERVISDFEKAGFRLLMKSDVLRNPLDDRSLSAFDPEVRSKTDRFVLVFGRDDDPEV